MSDVIATHEDWILKIADLQPLQILSIYPRKTVTSLDVFKAMQAQGYRMDDWRVNQHGSKIWIQKQADYDRRRSGKGGEGK